MALIKTFINFWTSYTHDNYVILNSCRRFDVKKNTERELIAVTNMSCKIFYCLTTITLFYTISTISKSYKIEFSRFLLLIFLLKKKKKKGWQSAVHRPLLSRLSVTQRYVLSRKSAAWIPGRAWFTICQPTINKSIGEQIERIAKRLISADA